ncbi:MAG: hypothetical protein ACI8W7_003718, partial [Gammaproteobacteria bacterium]
MLRIHGGLFDRAKYSQYFRSRKIPRGFKGQAESRAPLIEPDDIYGLGYRLAFSVLLVATNAKPPIDHSPLNDIRAAINS